MKFERAKKLRIALVVLKANKAFKTTYAISMKYIFEEKTIDLLSNYASLWLEKLYMLVVQSSKNQMSSHV